jgi:hypothetical protein
LHWLLWCSLAKNLAWSVWCFIRVGIGCPRAPPPPSDETCYEDLKCSASRCHLGCIHRGYKGTGSYCRGRDCCCKHWCTVVHLCISWPYNKPRCVSFASDDYKWNEILLRFSIRLTLALPCFTDALNSPHCSFLNAALRRRPWTPALAPTRILAVTVMDLRYFMSSVQFGSWFQLAQSSSSVQFDKEAGFSLRTN